MADSEIEASAQLSKGNHADLEYAAILLPLLGHHTLKEGVLWLLSRDVFLSESPLQSSPPWVCTPAAGRTSLDLPPG